MLYVPTRGGLNFSVNNQATPSLTPGTSITPGNNSFPAYAEILSDASVTEDCFGIFIRITGISVAATSKSALVNIGSDPTGGTSFATIIPNLLCSEAATSNATVPSDGIDYYFPLYIKSGTSLAAQGSVNNATVGTMRVYVKLFGGQEYAERQKWGFTVEQFGAVTASSKGTDLTPGNTGAEGTYVQMGSNLTNDYFWWQLGVGITQGTTTNLAYDWDLARGDGSSKQIMIPDESIVTGTSEATVKHLQALGCYERPATVGEGIYARGTCSGTANTGWSAIAYGMPV